MKNDIFKKREDEILEEYLARIYRSKIELGLTNKEIANKINEELGTNYGESTLRCKADLVNKILDRQLELNMKGKTDDEVKEIEEKIRELKIERKKTQAEKLELNRLDTKKARFEEFYDNIKWNIESLPLPDFKPLNINNENSGSYIECFTDLHYGADFISENNIYSREECKRRMEDLAYKTINKVNSFDINNLTIIGLGDLIQGILRISDVKLNDVATVQCVVEVSRLIASFLNSISEYTNITYYHTMASNHTQPRYLGTKANAMPYEDMEIIIGNYIKDLLRDNDRVKVVLSDKDYITLELEGQNIIAMHGHRVKSTFNAIRDLSQLHRKFYDICFLGHFHGGQSMYVGEGNGCSQVVVVPSIVGSDPYSDSLTIGSKSMAKMYKIEKNIGITEEYTFVLN